MLGNIATEISITVGALQPIALCIYATRSSPFNLQETWLFGKEPSIRALYQKPIHYMQTVCIKTVCIKLLQPNKPLEAFKISNLREVHM